MHAHTQYVLMAIKIISAAFFYFAASIHQNFAVCIADKWKSSDMEFKTVKYIQKEFRTKSLLS